MTPSTFLCATLTICKRWLVYTAVPDNADHARSELTIEGHEPRPGVSSDLAGEQELCTDMRITTVILTWLSCYAGMGWLRRLKKSMERA